MGAGQTLHIYGDLSGSGTATGSTATVLVDGNLTIGSYTATSGTTTVGLNFSPGAFSANGGTVGFPRDRDCWQLGIYSDFYNFTLSSGTRTAVGGITVAGTLALNGGTFASGNYSHSIAGIWNDAAITFTPGAGTIVLTGASPTIQAKPSNSFYNLTLQNGGSLSSNVTVINDIAISVGTLSDAGNFSLTVGENWTNSVGVTGFSGGTSGTVVFADATRVSTITGNTNFTNLTSNTQDKQLYFGVSSQQTVSNTLTIAGVSGHPVVLGRSGGSGTQTWLLAATGTRAVTFASISNSDATSSGPIVNATNSLDLGNNTNWNITGSGSSWTGATDGTWTGANWSSGVPTATVDAIIPVVGTAYPTISAGAQNAKSLSIAVGASLTVTGGTLTIANGFSNGGTLYRVAGAGLVSQTSTTSGTTDYNGTGGTIQSYGGSDYYNLTIDSAGQTFVPAASPLHVFGNLHIVSGTLSLGSNNLQVDGNLIIDGTGSLAATGTGTVTVNGSISGAGSLTGGTSTIQSGGDFTIASYIATSGTTTVGGSWSVPSFLPGSGTVAFGGSGKTIAATSFNNLTLNSGASMTMAGILTVGVAATLNGSLSTASYDMTVTGAVTGTGILTGGSGILTIGGLFNTTTFTPGSGAIYLAGNCGVTNFSAGTSTVTFNGTSALTKTFTFNGLTIASGSSLDTGGFTVVISGAFSNQGTLYRHGGDSVSQTDAAEGTVTYEGSSGTIQSYGGTGDYYNLVIGDSATTLSYTLAGAIQVNNDLTITANGTLTGNNTVAVAENWSRAGTFTAGTGTVSFVNAAKATVISTTDSFYNLTSTAAGKSITLSATQTILTGGSFSLTGTPVNNISLTGSSITLVGTATAIATYATITNSTVSAASNAVDCTLTGTTTNWTPTGKIFTWSGLTSTAWDGTTTTNWSPNSIPGQFDAVIIPNVTNKPIMATGLGTAGTPLKLTSLTIQTGATLDVKDNYVTISSTFTNFGTLRRYLFSSATANVFPQTDTAEGLVEYNGTNGAGPYYMQDYGSQDYYDLQIDNGLTVTLSYNLGVNDSLQIGQGASGTLLASGKTISVGGTWTLSAGATFTHGNDPVIFADSSKTTVISGNTTFYNLSVVTPGKTMNFSATTTTITSGGSLTVTGTSGNNVVLTGTGWTLNFAGTTAASSVSFASADHGNISVGKSLTFASSLDNGNNNTNGNDGVTTGMIFTPAAGVYIWKKNAATSNWNTLGNWSTGSASPPGLTTDTVTIPAGVTGQWPQLTGNVGIGNLTIQAGAQLSIEGYSLSVSGIYQNLGTLYRSGASSMNVTDAAEGTVVYDTAGGTIQDYGTGNDYL